MTPPQVPAGSRAASPDHRFLLRLLRPYRGALLVALLLMSAQSATTLASPWLAGRFAAAVLQGRPVADLLLVWFGLIVVQAVLGYLVSLRMQRTASALNADACSRLFDHLQSLPLRWHQDRRRGEVLTLLTEDVQRLGYYVTGILTPLLPLLLTCAGALVMMLRIDPWIDAQHHHQGTGAGEQQRQQRGQDARHVIAQALDVLGQQRQHLATTPVLVPAQRQRLQVVEQPAAGIRIQRRGGALHAQADQVTEHRLDDDQAEPDQQKVGHRATLQHRRGKPARQPGRGQRGRALRRHQQQRHQQRPAVRPQQPQQEAMVGGCRPGAGRHLWRSHGFTRMCGGPTLRSRSPSSCRSMSPPAPTATLAQRVTHFDEVLFQEVGGEAVLLDLASEQYFGLDPVGTRRHCCDAHACRLQYLAIRPKSHENSVRNASRNPFASRRMCASGKSHACSTGYSRRM